jgi:hypothetical protein
VSERAIAWAQDQRCPNRTAKFVLMRLAAYADAEGVVWAFVERLADEIQASDRTVQRAMRQLEGERLIVKTGKFKGRNVPFYRLDLVGARAQTVTPVSPLNGDKLSPFAGSNGDTPVTPTVTPVSPQSIETNPEAVANATPSGGVRAGEASSCDDGFEALWASAPDAAKRGVSSRRQGLTAWRGEVAVGADPVAMAVGVRAYFADRTAWGASGRPKAFHTVLTSGCWESFVANGVRGAAFAQPTPGVWSGPVEVRAAYVEAMGADWTASWLDPCGWDAEGRCIVARTGLAADRLKADGRRILAELQVSVRKGVA